MAEETISPEIDSQGTETTEDRTPTSYMEGRYNSITELEAGVTTAEKRYEDYRSMNDKRFGSFVGSPDEYTMNEGLEASDSLQAYARENQFSNDALNGLVEHYNEDMTARNDAYSSEQREALGADVDARLNNVQDWAKANLSADVMDSFESIITSAKSVEMIEQIMKINSGTAPAQVQAPRTVVDKDTLSQMRFAKDEFGNRRMSTDKDYRAKVNAMSKELIEGRS